MTPNASRHHMMKRARRAFTLLELVIVLGIILLLMGLVLGVGSIVLRQSEDRQIRATMAIVDAALVEDWPPFAPQVSIWGTTRDDA